MQFCIFSRVLRDSTPCYVGQSVGWSVPFLLFWRFWAFWAYCSCLKAMMTYSSTAIAHPHATRVAVYPALFALILVSLKVDSRNWNVILLLQFYTD